jgi:mRNA interferase MazF
MARGDVLLVALPDSDKREEKGNRPAIAVQTDGPNAPMLMIVPITSALAARRFAFTIELTPSPMNGLTLPSIAMVFQMRAIDRKRIIKTIGTLEPEYLKQLDAEIRKMLLPEAES